MGVSITQNRRVSSTHTTLTVLRTVLRVRETEKSGGIVRRTSRAGLVAVAAVRCFSTSCSAEVPPSSLPH